MPNSGKVILKVCVRKGVGTNTLHCCRSAGGNDVVVTERRRHIIIKTCRWCIKYICNFKLEPRRCTFNRMNKHNEICRWCSWDLLSVIWKVVGGDVFCRRSNSSTPEDSSTQTWTRKWQRWDADDRREFRWRRDAKLVNWWRGWVGRWWRDGGDVWDGVYGWVAGRRVEMIGDESRTRVRTPWKDCRQRSISFGP